MRGLGLVMFTITVLAFAAFVTLVQYRPVQMAECTEAPGNSRFEASAKFVTAKVEPVPVPEGKEAGCVVTKQVGWTSQSSYGFPAPTTAKTSNYSYDHLKSADAQKYRNQNRNAYAGSREYTGSGYGRALGH